MCVEKQREDRTHSCEGGRGGVCNGVWHIDRPRSLLAPVNHFDLPSTWEFVAAHKRTTNSNCTRELRHRHCCRCSRSLLPHQGCDARRLHRLQSHVILAGSARGWAGGWEARGQECVPAVETPSTPRPLLAALGRRRRTAAQCKRLEIGTLRTNITR